MNKVLNGLVYLFDEGKYSEINSHINEGEVICANGIVNGKSVYAFYLDNSAFNADNCKKIIKLYELAVKTGAPIVGYYSSAGVDLGEGFSALNEYSALLNKCFSVSGVVPQISVINGECLGVAAVMSNTADIVIGVTGNDFYLSANDENTTDDSFKNGVADIIVENEKMASEKVRNVLSLLPQNNLSPVDTLDYSESSDLVDNGSFIEFKSDYSDKVKTGLATLGGISVGIIDFNGNALGIKNAYKAEQLIKLCNAYNLPIITVADSSGFDKEEPSAFLIALTKLTSAYANSTTVKISVIRKEINGGAFVTLAGKGSNADITIAVKGAVISPMKIDSAVAFLYDERLAQGEDRTSLETEYRLNEASAENAAKNGAADIICNESELRDNVLNTIIMLSSKRETTIPRKHTIK